MFDRMSSNAFTYAVVAGLRTHQLIRGCPARVSGEHKVTTIALREVAAGKIVVLRDDEPVHPRTLAETAR